MEGSEKRMWKDIRLFVAQNHPYLCREYKFLEIGIHEMTRLPSSKKDKVPTFQEIQDKILIGAIREQYDQVKMSLYYGSYRRRIESYKNWEAPEINTENLAKAGFYYLGYKTAVQCYCCGILIKDWKKEQNPIREHLIWNLKCKHIQEVFLQDTTIARLEDAMIYHTITTLRREEMDTPAIKGAKNHLPANELDFFHWSALPRNPKYINIEARHASFETCTNKIKVDVKSLAEAGFYYTGHLDHTVCFHCNVHLNSWQPNSNPWEQHALSAPYCPYVILIKGRKFIYDVKQRGRSYNTPSTSSTN